MRLSIVSTLYGSSPYLNEFHRRASAAARELVGSDYEVVLVNDGSPDDSLELAVRIAESDPCVVVVDLSRNFGHHKAMMTGLLAAKGDRVFLIDSDLEEEPEWLLGFSEQMRAENADMIYGLQAARKGTRFERFSGAVFYQLFRLLTGVDQPANIVTARLMSRRYVDALVAHRERELNIGGLWIITGFKQSRQIVMKHSTSPTTYALWRKIDHLFDAVTSFSNLPLFFVFYCGMALSASAALYSCYLVIMYLFASPPGGYTSIIVSIWFFSGIVILFIGLQGIYIGKIFSEVKQRPYTIVRQVYRHPQRREL